MNSRGRVEFIRWLVGSMVSEWGRKHCAHSTELDSRLVAVPNFIPVPNPAPM